ncbi:MAG: fructose-6-phosphate aldolase [Rickettsiales bacterium]
MKFFIDSADVEAIKELYDAGLADGVTTNPSIIYKSGRDFKEVVKEICDAVPGDVSAEVASVDFDGMMREADILRHLAPNVTVKLPLTWEGLRACRRLAQDHVKTNMTLCFSASQALLAAKAGATYVSPFIGRLDDASWDGMQLIRDCVAIFRQYSSLHCEVLAASIRHPLHVVECAKAGAHVITAPPSVIKQLISHPLTDKGLAAFLADWKKTGQTLV